MMLIERTKPEIKKAIEMFEVEYPNTAGYVIAELRDAIGVSYLSYGTVLELENIIRNGGRVDRVIAKVDLTDPWSWFEGN